VHNQTPFIFLCRLKINHTRPNGEHAFILEIGAFANSTRCVKMQTYNLVTAEVGMQLFYVSNPNFATERTATTACPQLFQEMLLCNCISLFFPAVCNFQRNVAPKL
jgi:hypothetical protein